MPLKMGSLCINFNHAKYIFSMSMKLPSNMNLTKSSNTNITKEYNNSSMIDHNRPRFDYHCIYQIDTYNNLSYSIVVNRR